MFYPSIEKWSIICWQLPWLKCVGKSEGEISGCDDKVGSNCLFLAFLQYSEENLQLKKGFPVLQVGLKMQGV